MSSHRVIKTFKGSQGKHQSTCVLYGEKLIANYFDLFCGLTFANLGKPNLKMGKKVDQLTVKGLASPTGIFIFLVFSLASSTFNAACFLSSSTAFICECAASTCSSARFRASSNSFSRSRS